jgi:8-oxo-dGTP pyrophosphatase MutT (NUDIX family)
MHDQENLASSSQSTAPTDAVTENGAGTAADAASTTLSPVGSGPEVKVKKKKKKKHKALEDRTVYEAGAIIVCDSKVVLRLTDKQRWLFPKGKLKKHESPQNAAMREATEETGLKVEVVDQAGDLLIYHEGKKRRFMFYLMRATAKTWDWPHHDGRDTFLIEPDRIGALVRNGYAKVWASVEQRARALCDEPTPFETHQPARADVGENALGE